jgi:hypothetical protein
MIHSVGILLFPFLAKFYFANFLICRNRQVFRCGACAHFGTPTRDADSLQRLKTRKYFVG